MAARPRQGGGGGATKTIAVGARPVRAGVIKGFNSRGVDCFHRFQPIVSATQVQRKEARRLPPQEHAKFRDALRDLFHHDRNSRRGGTGFANVRVLVVWQACGLIQPNELRGGLDIP